LACPSSRQHSGWGGWLDLPTQAFRPGPLFMFSCCRACSVRKDFHPRRCSASPVALRISLFSARRSFNGPIPPRPFPLPRAEGQTSAASRSGFRAPQARRRQCLLPADSPGPNQGSLSARAKTNSDFLQPGALVEGSRWSFRVEGERPPGSRFRIGTGGRPGGLPENNVGITPRLRNLFLHES